MKMDRFVFEVMVTLWLPGSVACAGLLLWYGVTWEQVTAFITWARDAEFLVTLLLSGVVTLVGLVIAAIHGVIEEYLLDRWLTPWLVGINPKTFDKEWKAYLWDLPNSSNPYIGRLVLFFMLETRMGMALLFLAISLWGRGPGLQIAAFIAAGLFYWLGVMDHRGLAQYRHDHYTGGKLPAIRERKVSTADDSME